MVGEDDNMSEGEDVEEDDEDQDFLQPRQTRATDLSVHCTTKAMVNPS